MEAYLESLDYLYRFTDFSLDRELRYAPERFDLQRMVDFLALLGRPQDRYPIIHIAGTKGKGSVAAFCAAVLQAAGYRTGLYTSPHLHDYTERIQVNGEPISHPDFVEMVSMLKPHLAGETALTTFEITTALALLYFQRRGVTAAVLEVGLGGRLDATNVVEPMVTVITSISYDHMEFLGSTLAQIAGEKAGIIKPGVPVVVAPQQSEALRTIEKIAAERNAPLLRVDQLYGWEQVGLRMKALDFRVWPRQASIGGNGFPESALMQFEIPLLGRHQMENAVTAFAALQAAQTQGLVIPAEAYRQGLAQTKWPARFEILQHNPAVIVDAAHNLDSARRLRATLDEYFPDVPVTLIFGASGDKDLAGFLGEFLPRVQKVIFTRANHPRAVEPEKLAGYIQEFTGRVSFQRTAEAALDEALTNAAERSVILAAGSVFLAAEIRQAWQTRSQVPVNF